MKDLSNENVININKDGVEYLQFKKLLEYKDIINHAYSLGIDKNYRTTNPDNTPLEEQEYNKNMEDYKNLCEKIGANYKNAIRPNQEHTDVVRIAQNKINNNKPDFNEEEYNKTDGLVTNQKSMLLATTNADCILLIFFDPVKKVIANTHSGWKGTLQRISVKTIEKMQKEFNCNPEDIICCICPSIRKCHFEVGKDVKEQFGNEFKDIEEIESIIEKKETKENTKWNIDTVEINKIILKKQGLKEENIIDSKICSVCNSDLVHSYRVEKQGYGLSAALIELI